MPYLGARGEPQRSASAVNEAPGSLCNRKEKGRFPLVLDFLSMCVIVCVCDFVCV